MFCETSSFYCTVHKMCFFFTLCSFLLPMVFPFTTGVSVHVLRTMFVPGWGGPFELINFMSFLCFPSADTHFAVIPPQIYFFPAHPLQPVLCFLSLLDLLLTSSFSFSPLFLMFFLHIFLLPLPLSLPQRSPGSPVVCLLEGIPTPPPPPLEPRSVLPRSLAFPLSPFFKKIFFLHLFLMWKF